MVETCAAEKKNLLKTILHDPIPRPILALSKHMMSHSKGPDE